MIKSLHYFRGLRPAEFKQNRTLAERLTETNALLEKALAESRRREIALRRAEERYWSIFDNAVEGMFQTTLEGRFLAANPALARMLGFQSPAELMARVSNIGQQLHVTPERRAEFGRLLQEHGLVQGFECQVYRKDNSIIWVSIAAQAVRNAGGRLLYFEGTVKDITDLPARTQAEGELARTAAELRIARTIQQKLFPSQTHQLPGLESGRRFGFDLGGASYPADAVGGDYYDFLSLPDGSLGIAIGDVSGHGIGPALLMAEVRALLRAFAQTEADVSKILGLSNRVLASDIDGDRFVTLLLVKLDPGNHTLVYASAGHETGYLLDASGAVKEALGSTSIPLGIRTNMEFPASSPIPLQPGDLLLLLTDGITETCSPDGAVFGSERAVKVVRGCAQVTNRPGDCRATLPGGVYVFPERAAEGRHHRDGPQDEPDNGSTLRDWPESGRGTLVR